jgi:hypothetical protein
MVAAHRSPYGLFASVHCISSKAECEHHPAARIVVHRDGALMRLHDLSDDRKAETSAAGALSLATPESLEHVTPLVSRDPGSTVRDAHAAIGGCGDHYLAPGNGVSNRVLDQISDCIANRVSVPSHDAGFSSPLKAMDCNNTCQALFSWFRVQNKSYQLQ